MVVCLLPESGGARQGTATHITEKQVCYLVCMALHNTPLPEDIAPFMWVDHDNGTCSVILYVGNYLVDVFETRADEGFEGSGYDWNSLALVFLEEKMPEVSGLRAKTGN